MGRPDDDDRACRPVRELFLKDVRDRIGKDPQEDGNGQGNGKREKGQGEGKS